MKKELSLVSFVGQKGGVGGTGLEASNHYLREIAEGTSAAMLKRVFG